jgi:hypothetical protein
MKRHHREERLFGSQAQYPGNLGLGVFVAAVKMSLKMKCLAPMFNLSLKVTG